jgi:hypothetical protein
MGAHAAAVCSLQRRAVDLRQHDDGGCSQGSACSMRRAHTSVSCASKLRLLASV